tara:strand:+ start:309 stop:581 length:273 start_codon:yes stop_codon:yes gene_type:complete
MTIANNKVMPAFPPVIIRDNLLLMDSGDDGSMILELYFAVGEAVNSNLTTGDALRVARAATEWDTGVQPPIRAVIDMYRFVTRNQKGETR